MKRFLLAIAVLAIAVLPFGAQAPIQYRFSFPEPEHRWMQVNATFNEAPDPLELRMSSSSPGRYALHEFAKNVYDVHAVGRDGRELAIETPDPSGWVVRNHGGSVSVSYKVFGDVIDGTYLAVGATHVHVNMPAAVMWARRLDDRPATLTFVPPDGRGWRAATQLHAGSTPLQFTAPNLQYLMDSPVEIGPLSIREFTVGPRTFRLAVHHDGTDADLDGFAKDVEKIVRQEGAIYGEYPAYEPGFYTFLADYLPYAVGDGMEHRNSTVMTQAGSIRQNRTQLLETVAHEFFHSWNVERIRPRSLEPFDFDRVNVSGELWLAEGFTQYYGPLVRHRAGLADLAATTETLTGFLEAVTLGPGRAVRSAEEMSRMASFTDGGVPIDRTNWSNTVISYYSQGAAIALALDLTLRDRSNSETSLDDYMRAMWRVHGRPGGSREGYVDRPYTEVDAEARLAEVSGDPSFARDFFNRYVHGREIPDYPRLLARAGLEVHKRAAGRAWLGDLRFEPRSRGLQVGDPVPSNTPAYRAGLEQDDELTQIDGSRLHSPDDLQSALDRHRPGDRVTIAYVDRGVQKTASVTLVEDPHVDIVPSERLGHALTPAARAFRESWLTGR